MLTTAVMSVCVDYSSNVDVCVCVLTTAVMLMCVDYSSNVGMC